LTVAAVPAEPAKADAVVAGAMTVAGFLGNLSGLVDQIVQGAHDLIAQGDMVAAQQQMLLAGIIEGVIKQVEEAYADSLDRTIEGLDTTAKNTFDQLQRQVEGIDDLRAATSGDIHERIYQAQGAANQLLNRLPLTRRQPVFYGMAVGEILADRPSPVDIKIFGFHLSDPDLGRKLPVVRVDGHVIGPANLSVREDRIEVRIPDDLNRLLKNPLASAAPP
jgi:hypothetical protein